jgi:hypothetical protein
LDTTIKLKVGYVLLRNGDPVKTGRIGAQTAKLYQHAGRARAAASRIYRHRGEVLVTEAFIEVPGE